MFRTLPTPGAPYGTTSVDFRPSWRVEAACQDTDPELFYPMGDITSRTASVTRAYDEAKSYCREHCPVVAECLEDALETEGRTTFGVRGATDPEQRKAIIRHRDRAEKRSA